VHHDDDSATEALLAAATARLTAAGARDELLADLVERRTLGIRRAPVFEPVERVWRLGVLLLGRSGALYATGTTMRVSEPRHPNAQSQLGEERRELRAIALKAGIAPGETIDFDAHRIRLDDVDDASRPLARIAGDLLVRWSPTSATLTPVAGYLTERVELLTDPPAGA
jgi:hypothetical protein